MVGIAGVIVYQQGGNRSLRGDIGYYPPPSTEESSSLTSSKEQCASCDWMLEQCLADCGARGNTQECIKSCHHNNFLCIYSGSDARLFCCSVNGSCVQVGQGFGCASDNTVTVEPDCGNLCDAPKSSSLSSSVPSFSAASSVAKKQYCCKSDGKCGEWQSPSECSYMNGAYVGTDSTCKGSCHL